MANSKSTTSKKATSNTAEKKTAGSTEKKTTAAPVKETATVAAKETKATTAVAERETKATPASITIVKEGSPLPSLELDAYAVAQRAYFIWESQGYAHGFDREHWLAAEEQLKREWAKTAK